MFLATRTCASVRVMRADMTAHWAERLHELAAAERIPGAALGVWADGSESLAAHGVLNAATAVSTTADSLFQIGSITKVWTATMIMQFIDEGRLSLDATVSEILPGARLGREDDAADVSIRHLLTHTSGIDGDIFTDTGRGADCVERYVGSLGQAARIFPPGATYSYCNSGFVVLGRVIEVLDGREWDASLSERLIGRLGIGQTVTLPEQAILHRAATGHREHPRENEPVSVWGLPRSLGPAGLITASVHDVLTFARLHLDEGVAADGTRVLRRASVWAMQQPQHDIPGVGGHAEAVGLAWRLSRWDGRLVIGHAGSTIGQSAFLRIDPQERVAACLLTNSPEAQGLYQQLFSEIFSACAGVTVPASAGPVARPTESDLSRHTGRYERTSRRLEVSIRDGRLHCHLGDDRRPGGVRRRGTAGVRPVPRRLCRGCGRQLRVPPVRPSAVDPGDLRPARRSDAVPFRFRSHNAARRVTPWPSCPGCWVSGGGAELLVGLPLGIGTAAGQRSPAWPPTPRGRQDGYLADQMPDPAHAVGGRLRMVAELLRHPARAAADAKLPHGAAHHLGQRGRGRCVRPLQLRCEERLTPRVVHV